MTTLTNYSPYATRWSVLRRDGFTCQYCGQKAPNVILHVDHVNPKSNGGEYSMENLVTACGACNVGKGEFLNEQLCMRSKEKISRRIPHLLDDIVLFFDTNKFGSATQIARSTSHDRANVANVLRSDPRFEKLGRIGSHRDGVLYTITRS